MNKKRQKKSVNKTISIFSNKGGKGVKNYIQFESNFKHKRQKKRILLKQIQQIFEQIPEQVIKHNDHIQQLFQHDHEIRNNQILNPDFADFEYITSLQESEDDFIRQVIEYPLLNQKNKQNPFLEFQNIYQEYHMEEMRLPNLLMGLDIVKTNTSIRESIQLIISSLCNFLFKEETIQQILMFSTSRSMFVHAPGDQIQKVIQQETVQGQLDFQLPQNPLNRNNVELAAIFTQLVDMINPHKLYQLAKQQSEGFLSTHNQNSEYFQSYLDVFRNNDEDRRVQDIITDQMIYDKNKYRRLLQKYQKLIDGEIKQTFGFYLARRNVSKLLFVQIFIALQKFLFYEYERLGEQFPIYLIKLLGNTPFFNEQTGTDRYENADCNWLSIYITSQIAAEGSNYYMCRYYNHYINRIATHEKTMITDNKEEILVRHIIFPVECGTIIKYSKKDQLYLFNEGKDDQKLTTLGSTFFDSTDKRQSLSFGRKLVRDQIQQQAIGNCYNKIWVKVLLDQLKLYKKNLYLIPGQSVNLIYYIKIQFCIPSSVYSQDYIEMHQKDVKSMNYNYVYDQQLKSGQFIQKKSRLNTDQYMRYQYYTAQTFISDEELDLDKAILVEQKIMKLIVGRVINMIIETIVQYQEQEEEFIHELDMGQMIINKAYIYHAFLDDNTFKREVADRDDVQKDIDKVEFQEQVFNIDYLDNLRFPADINQKEKIQLQRQFQNINSGINIQYNLVQIQELQDKKIVQQERKEQKKIQAQNSKAAKLKQNKLKKQKRRGVYQNIEELEEDDKIFFDDQISEQIQEKIEKKIKINKDRQIKVKQLNPMHQDNKKSFQQINAQRPGFVYDILQNKKKQKKVKLEKIQQKIIYSEDSDDPIYVYPEEFETNNKATDDLESPSYASYKNNDFKIAVDSIDEQQIEEEKKEQIQSFRERFNTWQLNKNERAFNELFDDFQDVYQEEIENQDNQTIMDLFNEMTEQAQYYLKKRGGLKIFKQIKPKSEFYFLTLPKKELEMLNDVGYQPQFYDIEEIVDCLDQAIFQFTQNTNKKQVNLFELLQFIEKSDYYQEKENFTTSQLIQNQCKRLKINNVNFFVIEANKINKVKLNQHSQKPDHNVAFLQVNNHICLCINKLMKDFINKQSEKTNKILKFKQTYTMNPIVKNESSKQFSNCTLIFYDIECISKHNVIQEPYTLSYNIVDFNYEGQQMKDNCYNIWGRDCCEQFVQVILQIANDNVKASLGKNKRGIKNTIIYSYNGRAYDNLYIFPKLLERFNENSYKMFLGGSPNDIKQLKVQKNLEFQDIAMMFGCVGSLKSQCQLFLDDEHQKMDFQIGIYSDWEMINNDKQKIIAYCNQDVKVLFPLYKKLIDTISEAFDYKFSFLQINTSLASIAIKVFRCKFLKFVLQGTQHLNVLEIERKSFSGGHSCVYNYNNNLSGLYVDFCSLYPSCMAEAIFPTSQGELELWQYRRLEKHQIQSEYLYIIEEFEFEDNVYAPNLPQKCKNGLMFFPKKFQDNINPLVFWGFELLLAYDLGIKDLRSQGCIIYAKNELIFKEFIENCYKSRLIQKQKYAQYKDKKANCLQQIFKLIMNSSYGKFGQKCFDRHVYVKTSMLQQNNISKTLNGQIQKIVDINSDFTQVQLSQGTQESTQKIGSLVRIASKISALGRTKLFRLINLLKNDIYYCDTDSAFFNENRRNDVDALFKLGDELGQLKIEDRFNEAQFYGCKMYQYKDSKQIIQIKCKGVQMNVITNYLKGKNLNQKQDIIDYLFKDIFQNKNNKVYQEVWRRSIKGVQINESIKRIRCTAKRIIKENGETIALKQNEFDEMIQKQIKQINNIFLQQ